MNGVILYADDDVLQPNSFENKLFSKFHADSKYPILPITSIQDLERTIQSLSTIRVLILDWEFRVPKEDQDMPDRNENPLDWLMSHHIYSLIYIYSRVDIKDKIKKDLETRYGKNKIFFKQKEIINNCYFTHTMAIPTLIYKFYNSILSINLRVYTLKFPCT